MDRPTTQVDNAATSSPTPDPVFIVGAGPGLGAATARRFAREGHPIGLLARDPDRLAQLVSSLRNDGIRVEGGAADIMSDHSLTSALDELIGQLGFPRVVLFSPHPDVDLIKPVGATSAAELRASLELSLVGSGKIVDHFLPRMRETGGTLLFTTGSAALDPSPERAAMSVTTSAQTLYLSLLQQAVAGTPMTVHHITVVGAIGNDKAHRPEEIADHLWRIHYGPTGATVIRARHA